MKLELVNVNETREFICFLQPCLHAWVQVLRGSTLKTTRVVVWPSTSKPENGRGVQSGCKGVIMIVQFKLDEGKS